MFWSRPLTDSTGNHFYFHWSNSTAELALANLFLKTHGAITSKEPVRYASPPYETLVNFIPSMFYSTMLQDIACHVLQDHRHISFLVGYPAFQLSCFLFLLLSSRFTALTIVFPTHIMLFTWNRIIVYVSSRLVFIALNGWFFYSVCNTAPVEIDRYLSALSSEIVNDHLNSVLDI